MTPLIFPTSALLFAGHISSVKNWSRVYVQGVPNYFSLSGRPGTACDFAFAVLMDLPIQGRVRRGRRGGSRDLVNELRRLSSHRPLSSFQLIDRVKSQSQNMMLLVGTGQHPSLPHPI